MVFRFWEENARVSLFLRAVTFDANDPGRLADFWAGLLGWQRSREGDVETVVPDDGTGVLLRFAPSSEPKRGLNQTHLELTSTSAEHQQESVDRALRLGATHLDLGQTGEEGHVVLADPEGNELCVLGAGNRFLAGCPPLGNVNADGTQALGFFWAEALGRPLVWDQDEETAIRASDDGPMMAWGGPPVEPKLGKNRLHLDVAPPPDGDLATEVERLVGLGATRLDVGQGDVRWVVLADVDGNELCVHPPAGRPL